MRALLAAFSLAALASCGPDETISGFVDPRVVYVLATLDGAPVTYTATLQFPAKGEVAGQAPCNRYFARQVLPYPWFKVEAIGSTRMACPQLQDEISYFDALGAMSLAEVAGKTLILSNETGREMVFRTP